MVAEAPRAWEGARRSPTTGAGAGAVTASPVKPSEGLPPMARFSGVS